MLLFDLMVVIDLRLEVDWFRLLLFLFHDPLGKELRFLLDWLEHGWPVLHLLEQRLFLLVFKYLFTNEHPPLERRFVANR